MYINFVLSPLLISLHWASFFKKLYSILVAFKSLVQCLTWILSSEFSGKLYKKHPAVPKTMKIIDNTRNINGTLSEISEEK